MAKHTIALIPGDGIGPEVTDSARAVLEAAGLSVEWAVVPAGASALEQGFENVLPERTVEAVRSAKVALKGPVTTPVGKGFKSVNVQLRQKLNLYAAVRPVTQRCRGSRRGTRTSTSSSSARTPRGCTAASRTRSRPAWSPA